MNSNKITVVNITSVSYSGSTWLNLMIGAHPDIFSIGEVDWIDKNKQALCGLHGEDCPVWSQFDIHSTENIFVQISQMTGKKVLVVNNARRYGSALNDPRIDSKFIWIIRDGRAVVASGLRKGSVRNIFQGIRSWKKKFKKIEKQFKHFSSSQSMKIYYEACVERTEEHMREVATFLGLEYSPQMLDYYDIPRHFIGGNPGVLSVVANKQESGKLYVMAPEVGRKDVDVTKDEIFARSKVELSHYRKTDPKHFVDNRWKNELSDFQISLFNLLAGRVNRQYGYPSKIDRHEAGATENENK